MSKGLTYTREWTPLGGGHWQGTVHYQHDEYGRPSGRGVRWTNKGGEIQFATTGHGGIGAETAALYAEALLKAIAEANESIDWCEPANPSIGETNTYGGE